MFERICLILVGSYMSVWGIFSIKAGTSGPIMGGTFFLIGGVVIITTVIVEQIVNIKRGKNDE